MKHFPVRRPHAKLMLAFASAVTCCLFSACKEEEPETTTTSETESNAFSASEAEKGVVRVIVAMKSNRGVGYGSGSGFYIGNEHIITNHHVIAKASQGKLVVARKIDQHTIGIQDARVIWKDHELDIAILKAPGITCEEQTLSEAPIEKGSRAFAIGYPTSADASRRGGTGKMGKIEVDFVNLVYSSRRGVINNAGKGLVQFLDPTVSSGEIRKVLTRKWRPEYKTELEVIDHDVNIGHGNSGGPLFDACGRVIGINTQGLDAQTIKGLSLADNVKNSSRITELINVLKSQSISATVTSEPCVLNTGSTSTTTVAGLDWKIWTVLGVVGLAAVAGLVVAIFKKPAAESYTQYLKRVSGVSRLQSRPVRTSSGPSWQGGQVVGSSPPPPAPAQTPPPSPPPAPASPPPPDTPHGWTLQGSNPEPGKSRNVHFQLTPEQFERYGGEITLGRKPGAAHLVIDNTSISKAHAILSRQGAELCVRDNGSSNGTKVNGNNVSPGQNTPLRAGDQLQLGEVTVSISHI